MIEKLQTLLFLALDRIPLLLAVALIIITGNLIWETGGQEVVHKMLRQRRTGWLFLGWLFLLASLIMIGYMLDNRVSWWYAASAAVGSMACIIALALMVRSTAIDLNTATVEELAALRPIDGRLARRIIEYRSRNGNFGTPADLKHVPGIDDSLLDQISSRICAGPAEQGQDAEGAVGPSVAQHAAVDEAGMPPAPAQPALKMNQVGAMKTRAQEQPASTADEEQGQEQEIGGTVRQVNSGRHSDKKAGDK